jgi:6-phosphofructokinase 1
MRIGVLTGGGDSPGINAVIRAVTARAVARGDEVVGVLRGWEGLMEGDVRPLDRDAVRGILKQGGTILGTSRRDPYVHGDGWESVRPAIEEHRLDALVVIGGDGTLTTAHRLHTEARLPVVGVPKTIDNDIAGTEVTFGFDTAVHIATEAIDRLTTTAEAHNRVMLVEVMGRTRGWIAVYSGLASGADVILIPEVPYDLDDVAAQLRRRHEQGHRYSIVVVAEGVAAPAGVEAPKVLDEFGFERLGGVSYLLAGELERLTGFETRVTVLGYLQRGGTPTAHDRVLATRFGVAAADAAASHRFGTMTALHAAKIVLVPLEEVCGDTRGVPSDLYEVARTFFP